MGGLKIAEVAKSQSDAAKNNAVSIDAHVGLRIKQRRVDLGLSQGDLARELNTTWEQVIKYEAADNPITCERLYELSRVLRVPMAWFFIGAPGVDLTLELSNPALWADFPSSKPTHSGTS